MILSELLGINLDTNQVEALKAMLQLQAGGNAEPTWKVDLCPILLRLLFTELCLQVLVYDKTGQDIIGPLLSVKELRDLGVTLHLLLHSTRSAFSSRV